MLYRQGDVLIAATDTIPDGLTEVPRDNGRIVLAYGEVTGHAHAIDDPTALLLAEDVADIEERFLQVEREVQLVHEEHDTILLPPGNYIVRRQREYAPEANTLVAD